MVQAWRFTILGSALLIGGLLLTVVFGGGDSTLSVQVIMMSSAGVLFLFGGLGYELGSIEWYQLVGAGNVLLGLSFSLQFVAAVMGPGSVSNELLFIGAAAIGGLSLAYIGVDWIRGGKHFDLSQFDSSIL